MQNLKFFTHALQQYANNLKPVVCLHSPKMLAQGLVDFPRIKFLEGKRSTTCEGPLGKIGKVDMYMTMKMI